MDTGWNGQACNLQHCKQSLPVRVAFTAHQVSPKIHTNIVTHSHTVILFPFISGDLGLQKKKELKSDTGFKQYTGVPT
jgi:hypothetical protein